MGTSTDDDLQQWLDSPPEGVSGDTLHHHAMRRIRQLEKQCASLAAEVDRMRPVIEAACAWSNENYRNEEASDAALDTLSDACDDYQASNPK